MPRRLACPASQNAILSGAESHQSVGPFVGHGLDRLATHSQGDTVIMCRIGALMGWFIIAGLGSAQAQTQDLDPVGRDDWQVSLDGGDFVTGWFEIECPDEECSGYSYSDIGTAPILGVTVEGRRIALRIDGGEMGEIVVELTMDENDFTGYGVAGVQEFVLAGTKVQS